MFCKTFFNYFFHAVLAYSSSHLFMIVVGKLTIVTCDENKVKEICLDVKPKPIPLRDIISGLIPGTKNNEMIGKPKFFIFIHDETHIMDAEQLAPDSPADEEVKI